MKNSHRSSWIIRTAFILCCMFFYSERSHATHAHATNFYFTTIHFSTEAFGRPVKSVMAHVGVKEMSGWDHRSYPYWVDVQNVYLENKQDHFFGKILLTGKDRSLIFENETPVVQYWVDYADGSQWITPDYQIPISQDLGSFNVTSSQSTQALNLERNAFSKVDDTSKTEAKKLQLIAAD